MDRRVERKPWRRYAPWAAAAAGVLLLAVVAVFVFSTTGAKAVEADQVQIAEVRRAPFHDFVPARGTVAPLRTVFIDAVEGGRVEQIAVQDGALLAPGTLIAVLSNPQLERDVVAQEAAITGRIGDARGQLLQLQRGRSDRQRELELARYEQLTADRNLSIRENLHGKGFVADAELKRVSAEASFRRARVDTLQSSIRQEGGMLSRQAVEIEKTLGQLQGNLAQVRRTLDALQVRAPVGGRLTAFELQPGQTVRAGERVAQVDTEGAYKLIADVDEYYLGRVSVGQPATARHEGREYRVRVARILSQVRNGRFQAELDFVDAAPAGIRRGQSMDVEVTLGATRAAVLIPNGPFVAGSGGNWVFVVRKDGKRAERRAIRIGRRNPHDIEVLSGLQPGERILASSYDGLTQHQRLILR